MSNDSFKVSEIIFADKSFDGLLKFIDDHFKTSKIFILTDENTEHDCLPLLAKAFVNRYHLISLTIDSGEKNKNIETCIQLWNKLSDAPADRNSLLINLGGGVVSDLGAFVASTYLRGINFINIPTSLMGMVDAAIGGKNGIDFNEVKNQIGVINFPSLVFICPDFLKTLSDRHFKSGTAEVYKHALIADKDLWKQLEDIAHQSEISNLIPAAIAIKNKIVLEDPFESGKRKILNFGHTIGHAIESCFIKSADEIFHGEAVVAGMIMETMLSEIYSGLSSDASKEITDKLFSVFGKLNLKDLDFEDLLRFIKHDKKNQSEVFMFSLLNSIGKCSWNIPIESDQIKLVFDKFKSI